MSEMKKPCRKASEPRKTCIRPCKFYTYDEVVVHNKPEDFWVVIHGNVINLTRMLCDRADSWNSKLDYLMAFGGKDLSSFFHPNGMPRTEISTKTGKERVIFYPIVEVAQSKLAKTPGRLWSRDPKYHIGQITKQERRLRIINTLTGTTQMMKVCEEDSIYTIQEKYKKLHNCHAGSYYWRKDYKNGTVSGRLSLTRTLTENGLFHEKSGIGPPPAIWLFYRDDLTIA